MELPECPGLHDSAGDVSYMKRLRCPVCRSPLERREESLTCRGSCRTVFPVISGVPVLINEARSIFTILDYLTPTFDDGPCSAAQRIKQLASSLIPPTSRNVKGPQMFAKLAELLREDGQKNGDRPRIL